MLPATLASGNNRPVVYLWSFVRLRWLYKRNHTVLTSADGLSFFTWLDCHYWLDVGWTPEILGSTPSCHLSGLQHKTVMKMQEAFSKWSGHNGFCFLLGIYLKPQSMRNNFKDKTLQTCRRNLFNLWEGNTVRPQMGLLLKQVPFKEIELWLCNVSANSFIPRVLENLRMGEK